MACGSVSPCEVVDLWVSESRRVGDEFVGSDHEDYQEDS